MKAKHPLVLIALIAIAIGSFSIAPATAGRRNQHEFSNSSLVGSYASSGRAGGYLSRSIGVTTFDGNGNVRRVVSINTSDGEGGRKLLRLVSTGTYDISPEGLGVMHVFNEFESGVTSEVTYEFVVSKSSIREDRRGSIAEEITGIQREPGQTASLVEEYWTRRPGL
jgi:hypothetical protein